MSGYNLRRALYIASGLVLLAKFAGAVSPAALFSDHAILQAGKEVPVWGTAAPGEAISVHLGHLAGQGVADARGRWLVTLPPSEDSGESMELVITGQASVTAHDVRMGDVWLVSGQSNIAWKLSQDRDYLLERPAVADPAIRQFYTERTIASAPAAGVRGSWSVANAQTAGEFSAVAWYFAWAVHRATGRPIGLVNASWGNTPIEAWLPRDISQRISTLASTEKYQVPGALYNGMIYPLAPSALKGVIWYQGESNIGHATEYRQLFPVLIQTWRNLFGEAELPFYWVQLPRFAAGNGSGTDWSALREAQSSGLRLPATGEAIALDQGEAAEIHPRNKREVGLRLARLALHHAYAMEIADAGPVFLRAVVEGDSIQVIFRDLKSPLRPASDGSVLGFEVAGSDKVFRPALARIEGDVIIASAKAVAAPIAVRYAWHNAPESGLYNADGLPAGPFRSDNW